MKQAKSFLAAIAVVIFTGCSKNASNTTPEPPLPTGSSGYIAFFNNDLNLTFSHLTVLKFDGSESKVIFKDTSINNNLYSNDAPKWSFDRTKIIFSSNRSSGNSTTDLFVINNDGTGLRQVTNIPSQSEYFPSISPDGKTVVYASSDGKLYLCNLDGSNVQQLGNFISPSRSVHALKPIWSYDGLLIFFNANIESAAYNIYSIKADGTGLKRITYSTTSNEWLNSVSKNNILAYYSTDSYHVFTVNANGTNPKQVTNFFSGDPAISPDGSMIAFIAKKDKASIDEGYDVYTIKTDGSDLKRLTNTAGNKFYLDWK